MMGNRLVFLFVAYLISSGAQVQGQSWSSANLLSGGGQIASLATNASGGTTLFLPPPGTGAPGQLVFLDAPGRTVRQSQFDPGPVPDLIGPTVWRLSQSTGPRRGLVAGGSQQVLDFAGNNGITPQSLLSNIYISDSSGRVTWGGSLRSPDSVMSLADVYRAPGGEVYVAGKYFAVSGPPINQELSGEGHYFLVRLSPTGQVRWARRLADADTNFGYAGLVSLQPLGRHGVRVISGHRQRSQPGSGGYNLHAVDIDSAGRPSRVRSVASFPYITLINKVYTGRGHYYFYQNQYANGPGSPSTIRITKVDTALQSAQETNIVVYPENGQITTGYSLTETEDEGIYLTGTLFTGQDARLYAINLGGPLGFIRSSYRYPVCPGFDPSNHTVAALPGGRMVAAYRRSDSFNSGMLALDSTGRTCLRDTVLQPLVVGRGNSNLFFAASAGLVVQPKTVEAITFPLTQSSVDITSPEARRIESTCGIRAISLFADTVRGCGSSITLTPRAPSGVRGFLWSDGSAGSQLPVRQSGTYWVVASGTCGERYTDTVQVRLTPRPRIGLPDTLLLCPSGTLDTLQLSGGTAVPGVSYRWSPLQGLFNIQGAQAGLQAVLDSLGPLSKVIRYTLTATAGPGCDTTATVRVRAAQMPRTGSLVPLAPEPNDSIYVLRGSNSRVIQWQITGGAQYNPFPITDTARILWRGWYGGQKIQALFATVPGCPSAAGTYFRSPPDTVVPQPPLPDEILPNLVTANGDSINDHFEIKNARPGVAYTLKVYNQWGAQVQSGPYTPTSWPAPSVPAGTYVYLLSSLIKTWRGWVEVVK